MEIKPIDGKKERKVYMALEVPHTVHKAMKFLALERDMSLKQLVIRSVFEFVERERALGNLKDNEGTV